MIENISEEYEFQKIWKQHISVNFSICCWKQITILDKCNHISVSKRPNNQKHEINWNLKRWHETDAYFHENEYVPKSIHRFFDWHARIFSIFLEFFNIIFMFWWNAKKIENIFYMRQNMVKHVILLSLCQNKKLNNIS